MRACVSTLTATTSSSTCKIAAAGLIPFGMTWTFTCLVCISDVCPQKSKAYGLRSCTINFRWVLADFARRQSRMKHWRNARVASTSRNLDHTSSHAPTTLASSRASRPFSQIFPQPTTWRVYCYFRVSNILSPTRLSLSHRTYLPSLLLIFSHQYAVRSRHKRGSDGNTL